MVNNAFYATINELTQTFTEGDPTMRVVDYNSFIDLGRQLADLDVDDLANGFLNPLMNKVKVTIDTFRSYDPAAVDMFKGYAGMGVVEMITHVFYSTRQAPFVGLENTTDDSMIDFAKPEVDVKYFTETNAWQTYRSITDTELRGAWESPERMDAFIRSILGAVANSNKLHREVARLNLICGAIDNVISNNQPAQYNGMVANYIDLVAVYNDTVDVADAVTVASCLQNKDFVRWAVSYINQFREWMKKPSKLMNNGLIATFTPRDSQRLKVSSIFDAAIRRSLWSLYYREGAELTDYEVLPYWQNSAKADGVAVGNSTGTYSNVMATLYDDYALSEFVDFESVTSERNNKKLYTTYYYNFIYRYILNKNANFVVFTLGRMVEPNAEVTEDDGSSDPTDADPVTDGQE